MKNGIHGNIAQAKEKYSLVGQKIGRLTVVERADDSISPKGKKLIMYRCICDCGNIKIVRKCHLANGKILSCGCLHRELLGNAKRKHGYSHKERLYEVWLDMKDRCFNKNNNHYNSYGMRGITICEEWKNDYLSFRNWCISHGYAEEIRGSGRNNLTLDRIDVNGNYEPDNCRFVTNRENCLNKRNNLSNEERYRICPICGKRFTVSQRNQQQTCSAKCGQKIRKMKYITERREDGTFEKVRKA